MAKYKKMTDDEILVAIEKGVRQAVGYHDSKLSRERQDVLEYFHGERPKPQHLGNSRYISMDVYDAVESSKAALLETFAAGNQIVEFVPNGPEDTVPARVATLYTDYVIHSQNNGYKVFSDVITDGLLARIGIAKVYWDKREEREEEEFEKLPVEQFDMLISQPDVEIEEYEVDEDGLVSGEICRIKDTSQVCIAPIPPEEFLINSGAKDIDDASFVAHRVEKTRSELIAEGYSSKIVEKLYDDEAKLYDEERDARLREIEDDSIGTADYLQDQVRKVTVYECYVTLDIEGTGEARLWKIIKAGGQVLDKEEVNRRPFVTFVPLPIPHSFYGSNFAKKIIPIQNARTVLMRGILDHTVITNNPRYQVVKGSLVNPRELLDNRIGGVVNVTRPDGIMPLTQASLNPFVFQTIQLLDEDKEDTTGISKLSQGLNKDAISKQNSGAMVEQLVGLSQQRQKIVARNFANHFLVPLYLEVYRLVIENEDKKKIVELAGEWMEITPSRWAERLDVQVALKLGYGEQENEAKKYLGLHQLLTADPGVQPLYTVEKRFNMLRSFLEKSGVKNVSDYLLSPEEVQPPQPDPMQVMQMEMQKKQMELQERQVMVAEMKASDSAKMDQMSHDLDRMKTMINLMVSQREVERKEFDSTTRAEIGMAELEILKSQEPLETKQTQIVSPNA
jgi:hypothetical protein